MGIRASIVIAFLPIFLALGILSALIEHYLVKQELTWGLQEEAKSIALGTAAFLDRYELEGADAKHNEVIAMLPQVLKQRSLLGLAIFDAETRQSIASLETKAGALELAAQEYTPAVVHGADISKPFLSGEALILAATVPVFGPDGKLSQFVKVLIDASDIHSELAGLTNSLILRIVLLTALTLPVGWLLGTLLIKRLEQSCERARQIQQNPQPQPIQCAAIQELDEVNEMLEILAALLEERKAPRLQPSRQFLEAPSATEAAR